ncbi:streptogramin lyase [Phenylobacterium zucineum HLK1]|uniref:Virginiamycin B lyase n=1 Tax=Phenylobacterium zucineum (strain HLK1) TaxID=450851 RepID=B4R802_PHEZH|nr:membrane protein [Phenylobacterium zucineum]ACG77535.1 streptogramin lyase [Phenylobacterium zucineum HLK1]
MRKLLIAAAALAAGMMAGCGPAAAQQAQYFEVPKGGRPHDVAAAPDGTVWYTAQRTGKLGILDPKTGRAEEVPLGEGSAPHGVIVGPDGAAWITDGGLNAIVRVDPKTRAVKAWKLPEDTGYANLNTAAFDGRGRIWFTGQTGFYGRLDPASGDMKVWKAPEGRGPYGITATPAGEIYYVSLAGSHLAKVDLESGAATVIEPPTPDQGARRVWSDSQGRLWISEWNSGQLSRYDPKAGAWKSWMPPGEKPRTYSVYVDETDKVWITDFAANAILRFDPATETFQSFPSDRPGANVRQMLGRPGEAWGAESGTDRLVVIRY